MQLGVNLGYWGPGSAPADGVELARAAEELGYSVCWAAEAYGSDAVTVLSWIGARTTRIGVGAAVLQIPARSAAMTAMTAATLDSLSGGRFRLGLGVSGPQVSEGWHGVRFDAPLARTREYVDVVRLALSRKPLRYEGRHITLPLPDGPGKALRLTVHPVRPAIPVYLAAIGPRNLQLAGEIADGWLALFFSPEHSGQLLDTVREGRRKAGVAGDPRIDADDVMEGFDVVPTVPVAVADDVEQAAEAVRPYCALYVGGMGSREQNFYNELACRMGFEKEAALVQDLYLTGRHREAAAAVPLEFVDATSLLGPPDRIGDRLSAFAQAGVTTLNVSPYAGDPDGRLAVLRTVAEQLDAGGLAGR
ncbi:MAG: LLM class F420-dependent oxidoreductase [Actinomycetes bacterium]